VNAAGFAVTLNCIFLTILLIYSWYITAIYDVVFGHFVSVNQFAVSGSCHKGGDVSFFVGLEVSEERSRLATVGSVRGKMSM